MGQTREQRIIKQLSPRPQVQMQTPIMTDMFLPNHSGIKSHPEMKAELSKYALLDCSNMPFLGDVEIENGSLYTDHVIGQSVGANEISLNGLFGEIYLTSNDGVVIPTGPLFLYGGDVTAENFLSGTGDYFKATGDSASYNGYFRVTQIGGLYRYPTIQSKSNVYIDCNNDTNALGGGSGYVGYFSANAFGFNDNKGLTFGTNVVGKHVGIYGSNSGSTAQTDGAGHKTQTLYIGLTDTDWSAPSYIACRYMLIIDGSDKSFDFAHPVQSNPTLFIHSANQSTSQWIGFSHDATDGYINVGTGDVKINANVNAVSGYKINGTPGVSGSFTTSDGKTVTVTNGLITSIV